MSKGVSGQVITTVISLILAIAALIVIWLFHEEIFKFFSETVIPAINRMLCGVQNIFSKVFGWVSGIITGVGTLIFTRNPFLAVSAGEGAYQLATHFTGC